MAPSIRITVYSSDTKAYRERTKRLLVSPYIYYYILYLGIIMTALKRRDNYVDCVPLRVFYGL